MISIKDKSSCCGCQACGDICPKKAISFKTDEEGFWYPEVDKSICVNCGLCDKACPILNIDSAYCYGQHEPVVYGGYHKNLAIRFDSTSGGAFSALANAMYKQGGYVAGAIQNEDLSVTNFISNKKRDLSRLRSSKYVQSSAAGLYAEIKRLLTAGEKVLACGSPCQMGALRTFLAKDYENLIVVDFICRATNSPMAYKKYMEYLETKYGSKVVSVKAKNKDHGWRSLARKVMFENGEVYYGESHDDHYRRGYHFNYYERPSCYDCKFKGFPRCADISLGDFWGIEKIDPSLDHNLGTSCIFVNTDKGRLFFEKAKDKLEIKSFSIDQVLAGNREPLMTSVVYPACDRKALFADMHEMSFDDLANKYFPLRKVEYRRNIKTILRSLIRLCLGIVRHPVKYARLIRWNVFCKNIDADFIHNRTFDVQRFCSLDLRPSGKIIIKNGSFRFGTKRNLKSRLETRLMVEDGARLEIGGNGYVGSGADIQLFKNSVIKLGVGDCFNSGLQIVCAESITFGDDVHVGRDVWIRDNNGEHYIIQPGYSWKAPVVIGSHCWIGSGVSIMKGVTIGEGTVVSANSVVTHSLPPRCIASGNPAEVIAENITWRP